MRRVAVAIVAVTCVLGGGVAAAASLGVVSARLTVSTSTGGIAATTCTLNAASDDSYVSLLNLLSNFGTSATLQVQSAALDNQRTFVRFDLSSCGIPANALVTDAGLVLFMNTAPAVTRTYEAHRVSASWVESTITWTNQPAVVAAATSTVSTGTTSNTTLRWTVTSDVQSFVDGTTNNGWRVNDLSEASATTRTAQFRSAEFGTAGQRPVLEITYYP